MNLPLPSQLEPLCRSLATLEAILCPEWEYRYYSFNQHWAPGQRMASMRDGCGSHWFLLWRDQLAFLKGYCKGLPSVSIGPIPSIYEPEANEPAFCMDETTFCAWWTGRAWETGAQGSGDLLDILDGAPSTYATWAAVAYERPVDVGAVARVYAHESLTPGLVASLNPELSLPDLEADLSEIGYPA